MLNELALLAQSFRKAGKTAPSRHPRISPMGKNRDVLIVVLNPDGKPFEAEVIPGETASELYRVEHRSAGASFPGFNLPTPLRFFRKSEPLTRAAIEKLVVLSRDKGNDGEGLRMAIKELFKLSMPRTFRENQSDPLKQSSSERQFARSCIDLVEELDTKFQNTSGDLKNLNELIKVLRESKPSLAPFSNDLGGILGQAPVTGRKALLLYAEILFGVLDWKNRSESIGTDSYWNQKAKQDDSANQPIYLDLRCAKSDSVRVAHRKCSAALNHALLACEEASRPTVVSDIEDAFGEKAVLQDKYPTGPKIAELGNMKLFSANTNEIRALERYSLGGSQLFPVSKKLVQEMSDALLYVAKEDRRGLTCRAIPGVKEKRDLLVAYLEGEPDDRSALAEMLGKETSAIADEDFATTAKQVIAMLEGKISANPNLKVRLLAFSAIDKAKKQLSLNRCCSAQEVVSSARLWEAGARNTPDVSIIFVERTTKRGMCIKRIVPSPLDFASTVNRVWNLDAEGHYASSFQRVLTTSDAYDIFFVNTPLSKAKIELGFNSILCRMSKVLIMGGCAKTAQRWNGISETVRLQILKTIAFLGITLYRLGHKKEHYMQESTAQLGRLLALADSLHQHYCIQVRKGETPSQLIGNALLSTALEQPVFALARLSERIAPYQAWAKTLKGDDAAGNVGLVKYFLGGMAECSSVIRVDGLPQKMSDADKAKLLLGYLADNSKLKTEES